MVALEPKQQHDDLLAARAVGRIVAVLVADLRGGLLQDDAVHGWVVQDAECDEAFVEEAETEHDGCGGEGVAGREDQEEQGLAAGAH
jgi:hypothetical protein